LGGVSGVSVPVTIQVSARPGAPSGSVSIYMPREERTIPPSMEKFWTLYTVSPAEMLANSNTVCVARDMIWKPSVIR